LANSRPGTVVDVACGVPEFATFSFYATANTAAFSGNVYDTAGNTIAKYSNGGLTSTTVYTAEALLGTITYGDNLSGSIVSGNLLKKFDHTDIAGFYLPTTIATTLGFTTGNKVGLLADINSPLLTASVTAISRVQVPGPSLGGSGGSGGGGGGSTTITAPLGNQTLAASVATTQGQTTPWNNSGNAVTTPVTIVNGACAMSFLHGINTSNSTAYYAEFFNVVAGSVT